MSRREECEGWREGSASQERKPQGPSDDGRGEEPGVLRVSPPPHGSEKGLPGAVCPLPGPDTALTNSPLLGKGGEWRAQVGVGSVCVFRGA